MNATPLDRLVTSSLLLAACLFAPLAGATQGEALPAETIQELTLLVEQQRCDELLLRSSELRHQYPDDVDLLTLEGNCRLRGARSVQRDFDSSRYRLLRIASGKDKLPPTVGQRLFRVDYRYSDEAARDQALDLFNRALKLAPTRRDIVVGAVAAHLDTGQLDRALRILEDHAPSLETSAHQDLGQLVQDQLRMGQIERARRVADALVRILSRSAQSHAAQALVLEQQGQALEAMKAYARAVERGNRHPQVRRQLALLQLVAGRLDEATATLVPLAPSSGELELWLALARSVAGNASALPIWEKVAARLARQEKPDPRATELIEHYQRLLGSAARPDAPMRLRGARHFIGRRLEMPALVEAMAAIRQDPTLIEGWLMLTRFHRGALRFDMALETLDGALAAAEKLGPDSPYAPAEIELQKVQALLGLERFQQASELARSVEKASIDTRFEQALAALGLGRDKRATELLTAVAESAGGHKAEAAALLQELGPPIP
ncbi:MAG: hypothetical protein Q9Q40_12130 [Acidobacteriota bacterium]|nr:hypothetical protein [Acidobacteriota bacterium]